ncbi:DUF2785 domain-containing protein [Liberiplasma polymorphum]|uniref:DUF2785 domain-containing protein n=1 Tax=Liberiplasma polymorphum TaxID=3374570 RepID=UPI0037725D93
MINQSELKQKLTEIKRNDWQLNKEDLFELTLASIHHIGTVDAYLRDDLILEFIWEMITSKQYTNKQLLKILTLCLNDDHLFYKLGLTNDDSVFNRSFSMLIIKQILLYFALVDNNLLNIGEFNQVVDKIFIYIKEELDYRGFVGEKGWAHSMAHAADALKTIPLCTYVTKNQMQTLMALIKEKVALKHFAYCYGETERFTSAIINAINSNLLTTNEIIDWINEFKQEPIFESIDEKVIFKENTKGLLRSLYFRIKFSNAHLALLEPLEHTIKLINTPYH